MERFGFPFILAVKGLSKADILQNFETRIGNDRETELADRLRPSRENYAAAPCRHAAGLSDGNASDQKRGCPRHHG